MKWLLIKRSGNRWGGECVGWEDKKTDMSLERLKEENLERWS